MSDQPTAYLVERREDGFGDVFPLAASQACTLGRAPTNRIILKDDLCSREHAEITCSDGRWRLRDLNSLNGTLINGERLDSDWELEPGDEIGLGRASLVFVEDMSQLPGLPPPPVETGRMSIKKRLGETRFLTPVPGVEQPEPPEPEAAPQGRGSRHALSRDLALLYQLALNMATAESIEQLCEIVLDALLEAIPAEVGAILVLPSGGSIGPGSTRSVDGRRAIHSSDELEVVAQRQRRPEAHPYQRVADAIFHEVLDSREAVLAEDAARDQLLREQESPDRLKATSLICAPILFEQRVLGVVHLYCTDPHRTLDGEDLEFAMAVARQLGGALSWLQRDASLAAANRSLRDQLKVESELVGESPPIRGIESQLRRVAPTSATCLIRGESGAGKELVARAIHFNSPRRDGPFVCLNCAALTETLLESELFGHEKGSFTGATDRKIGKFEAAHRGTIFLDEIGEMNVGTQAKLLRILEGHPFERVGGSVPIQVDVRVVAATNQPLEQAVQNGTFRRDLFYRLQVVEIRVPPLRERTSDIALLAGHFLERFTREMGRKIRGFTEAALKKMERHSWPGNVRELRNVVERAVALGSGPLLDADDIWLSSLDVARSPWDLPERAPAAGAEPRYQPRSLDELEKEHILRTLSHTDWNKSQAASILRIERSTLDRKIKAYDLKR